MPHPLRYLTANRVRLAVTAVVATGALVAVSLWLDWFVDAESRSPGLNSLLLILWLFGVLVVGAVDALLAGDLLFAAGWRETLMLSRGQHVRTARRKEADEDDAIFDPRRYRSYTIHFSVLLVAFAVGNLALVGSLGSGAMWRIQEVQLATSLRAEDPGVRARALERVTRLDTEALLPRFTMLAAELIDDPDEQVSRTAVDVVGRVAFRMRRAMEALRKAHEPPRWENALFERLQQTQTKRLAARFRHDEALRSRVALALGALQDFDALQSFETFLWQDEPDPETVTVIAVATGDMRDLQALAIPLALLQRGDEAAQAHAAWALGEILSAYEPDRYTREPKCVTEALQVIEGEIGNLPLLGRCALLETLIRIRDARVDETLFTLFDSVEEATECPRLELKRRFGRPQVVSGGGPFRIKVLEAIAAIAGGNERVLDWLTRRLGQGDLSPRYEREIGHMIELTRRSTQR